MHPPSLHLLALLSLTLSVLGHYPAPHQPAPARSRKHAAPLAPHRYKAGAGSINLTSGGGHRGNHTLDKRGGAYNGRATYYSASGTGACGSAISNSDFAVALNSGQYGDQSAVSPWCFETITISYGGKSHSATVMDSCPGCPSGGIDMTPALFQYFASESVGILYVEWSKGNGQATTTTTTTTSKTTTTTTATTTTTTTTTITMTTTTTPPATTTPSPTPTTSSVVVMTSPSQTLFATSELINATAYGSLLSASLLDNATATATATSALLDSTGTAISTGLAPSSALPAATDTPTFDAGGTLDLLNQLVLAYGGLIAANAAAASS